MEAQPHVGNEMGNSGNPVEAALAAATTKATAAGEWRVVSQLARERLLRMSNVVALREDTPAGPISARGGFRVHRDLSRVLDRPSRCRAGAIAASSSARRMRCRIVSEAFNPSRSATRFSASRSYSFKRRTK